MSLTRDFLAPMMVLLISSTTWSSDPAGRSSTVASLQRTSITRPDSVQDLLQDALSGLESPLRAVIQDSNAYREVWERATQRRKAPPAIDFTRDMVIVAAMGTRFATGYAIHIRSVRPHGPTLQVHVLLSVGCGPGDMLTYPIDIVRAPREDRRVVTFVEEVESQRCK